MKKNLLKLRKSIFKKFGLEVISIENQSLEYKFPEAANYEIDLIKLCSKFSMTTYERLFVLLSAIKDIDN